MSLLRRVVSFARAHLRILYSAKLHSDLSEAAVAGLIRRIVTEAVLGSDCGSHLGECRARVLKSGRRKILSTRISRQFIHLYTDEGSTAGVQELASFQAFVSGAEDRHEQPATFAQPELVGDYRTFERSTSEQT